MENIKNILASNLIGTVATLNEDGSPWATPVHIFADDAAVYWFSKIDHQHSQNAVRDPRVSVSLWSKENGQRGAYISGTVRVLDEAETESAKQIVKDTIGMVPPVFENTSAFRLEIGQVNTSKTVENRWYFYT